MKHPSTITSYRLTDGQTGRILQEYKPEKRRLARARRDRLDNAFGAYRYRVQPVFRPCQCAECTKGEA